MNVVFPYIGSENIGITYLSAVLKSNGINSKLAFEPSLFDDTKYLHIPLIPRLLNYNEKFANYIVSLKPDLLAFSVLTMNYLWALDIAKRVKSKFDIKTVFGGIHVQALPDLVLSNPQVDYIIIGEGEYALLELAKNIQNHEEVDCSIRNLGYKKNGSTVINPPRLLIEDLDELPFPDREMFSKYEDYKSSMLYLCGRGCPFKCTFCSNTMIRSQYQKGQKHVRIQSVDRCFKEMRMLLKKYNPESFQIQDDVFTINSKWMSEFCSRYPGEVGIPFQVTGYPSTITEEKVRQLKEAGCFYMQIGIQSLNKENRKNILSRNESNEDLINCIEWCKKYDMGISVDYIFFPWECNETDQLAAARFFHKYPPSRIANFYLSYLPGTEIIKYAEEQGYLNEEDKKGIIAGESSHYHAGGVFLSQKEKLKFLNNYYIFFILLITLPQSFGRLLFKLRAYKYTYLIPKTLLIIIKELIMPIFIGKFRVTPYFIKYAKYYFKNIGAFLWGKYS